ncbi:Maltose/maltodextrin ABC transporter, substrate binding periplasmic protein MalE [Microbacterium esteraromaticum]|uniref:Maltose/maltodextrin ABC transporter, substrate binding periplasmic protein MalE n=1 Tax=Microbacterium esteraromaticum TaxID=57043 RepID=A0A1R4KHT2_9MICO|nr:extracellular solute-binding protein [Microbacterium esteraromaticum]SJN43785.1 Maltose/maltodextrin ABC transporter, substrate binding periplasmic protein MalE [Microbacterium esteraromaticum]
MKRHLTTRTVMSGALIAVVSAGLLVGCAADEPGESGGEAAAGSIRILAVEGPETDALEAEAATFSSESGIDVKIDKVARDIWGQRKVAELTQDAGTYDVVFLGGGDDAVWMLKHAHVQDLTPYIGEDALADVVNHELFTTEDGAFVGAPQYYNFPVTLYRADLFEDPKEQAAFKAEYGRELAAPTTFDEFIEIATFFNRPDEGLYGTCLGGVDWSVFLDDTYFTYGQGANFGDLETGELTLDTPEQVASLNYIKQLTALSAPGWESLSFFDCDNQMKAGSVALYQNWLYAWNAVGGDMGDKLGIAPPAGEQTHLGAMLATIPEAAPNPDGAGEFIKWMLSDDFQLAQTEQTGNLPVLQTQQDSDEFAAALPELELLKSVAGRLTYLHSTWSGELGSGVSEAIAKVNAGEMTAEEAASWLQNEKFAGRKAIE